MATFNFNKIYVIESLNKDERQTGKMLYDDLLKWKEFQSNNLKTEFVPVIDKVDFFDAILHIIEEYKEVGYHPILHIEAHGNNSGLELQSKEFVTWGELYLLLVEINSTLGNHLFLTLAICHGAKLMSQITIDKPAPFFGFIGSFEEISSEDILIRYNEFYEDFLSTFNIYSALEKLMNANSTEISTYVYISSEDTFKGVYENYLNTQFTPEAIFMRVQDAIEHGNFKFSTQLEKTEFEGDFERILIASKEVFYLEHREIYFMTKEFPENKMRFNL